MSSTDLTSQQLMLKESLKALKRNGGTEDEGRTMLQSFDLSPELIDKTLALVWIRCAKDNTVLDWGRKYRGLTFINIFNQNAGYLKWVYEFVETDPDLCSSIQEFMDAHADEFEEYEKQQKQKKRKLILK